MTCKEVIPNTFIACGEGGNYCSDECLDAAKDLLDEVIEERTAGRRGVADWIEKLRGMPRHAPDCALFDFDPEKQLGPDGPCDCWGSRLWLASDEAERREIEKDMTNDLRTEEIPNSLRRLRVHRYPRDRILRGTSRGLAETLHERCPHKGTRLVCGVCEGRQMTCWNCDGREWVLGFGNEQVACEECLFLARLRAAAANYKPMSEEAARILSEGPEVSGGLDIEPEDE